MDRFDVVVVGGGMAGASVAFELAGFASVLLAEQEAVCGMHSTGRSAAVFTECYGSRVVRGLAMASRPLLENPPGGFADVPLLASRPLLMVERTNQVGLLAALAEDYRGVSGVRRLGKGEVEAMVPVLRPGYSSGGILEPGAADIDVHALHQGFLAGLRARGGRVITRSPLRRASRSGAVWRVEVGEQVVTADLIVDAAGAWGDEVALRAGVDRLGLTPLRRTACTVPGPGDHGTWPMVFDAGDTWYFKPEGPNLLASGADEIPAPPHDVKHREIDVAVAVDRINEVTTLEISHVVTAWAGLRTFTPDRIPAAGPDPDHAGFIWLVGQGGHGIKTSWPLARWVAGMVSGTGPPADLIEAGLNESDLDPARFR